MRKHLGIIAGVLLLPTVAFAGVIRVEFTDTATTETGFNLQRALTTTPADFATIATLPASTGTTKVTYLDSNLADQQKYCYRVNAFNAAGASGYTTPICATTLLSIPTGLTLTPQ